MIVDAHQHFWRLSRGDYPWPDQSVAPIFRDFEPDDLSPLLEAAGVDKTVVVQATGTVAETEFLLELADSVDWIAGVVGWTDFSDVAAVDTIAKLSRNPLVKGLRPMLQEIEDTDFILRAEAEPALSYMEKAGLSFDALIQPRHLDVIETLAIRYPALKIVIDHGAKPVMGRARPPEASWMRGMERLAACVNVNCKLSGLVTEVGPGWTIGDIDQNARVILDSFSPDRVMFGSDWPVVNLASDYATWIDAARLLIGSLDENAQRAVMGGTAMRFYGLERT